MRIKFSNSLIMIGVFMLFMIAGASDSGYLAIEQVLIGISICILLIATGIFGKKIKKHAKKQEKTGNITRFQHI